MPVLLRCPLCLGKLSVKDEYLGRAVRCPKCRGAIPSSLLATAVPWPTRPRTTAPTPLPPPPLAPEPTPEPPTKAAVGVPDQPVLPKPKVHDQPPSKPVAKAPGGEPKPTPRKSQNDQPRAENRPAPRRKPARDEYDDDEYGRKKGGSKTLLVIAILFAGLVLYVGFADEFGPDPVKPDIPKDIEDTKPPEPPTKANLLGYADLDVGTTTRNDTVIKLGTGKLATVDDLTKAFASEPRRAGAWKPMAEQQRVVIWRNGEDCIVAAFHPDGEGTARLQAKEWRPKSGAPLRDGELDDDEFLQRYRPNNGSVSAEELARAFRTSAITATRKYENKTLLIEGKLAEIDDGPDGALWAILEGTAGAPNKPATRVRVDVVKADVDKVLNLSRGQTVLLKGTCTGSAAEQYVDIESATFDSASPDPAPKMTAARLFTEYGNNPKTTDAKYQGRPITLTLATYDSKDGDFSFYIIDTAKTGPTDPPKIKVTMLVATRKQIPTTRGARVTVKGEYVGSDDGIIAINRAWIAP